MNRAKRVTVSEIKTYWEKQASGGDGKRFGAHSDKHITDLETWYVIKYALERYMPDTLIDVGCGKGERTKLFSKYVKTKTLGLDYSAGMIALAKKSESALLKFQRADILKAPSLPFVPDMIVSCRCLINLGTYENVLRVLRYFHVMLPHEGKLVLCECSEQGHVRLNRLRKDIGLKEIQTAWFNINLDEMRLAVDMKGLFKFSEFSRLGIYYLMTRVLYPASIKPRDPDPNSALNAVAEEIQRNVGIGFAEDFGRQYCVVGTRLK